MNTVTHKVSWSGKVTSVQPRIKLLRSFDQRSHSYVGYSLGLYGDIDGEERNFSVGIGKSTHVKHRFKVGDEISGETCSVWDLSSHKKYNRDYLSIDSKEAEKIYKLLQARILGAKEK